MFYIVCILNIIAGFCWQVLHINVIRFQRFTANSCNISLGMPYEHLFLKIFRAIFVMTAKRV